MYITSAFTFTTFIAGTYLQAILGGNTIIVNLIVSVLVILGLDPLRRYISTATDSLFFKKRVDYQGLTQRVSEILSTEIDLTKLIDRVDSILSGELKLKGAAILVATNGRFETVPTLGAPDTQLQLPRNSSNVKFLRAKPEKIVVLEELYRKIADTAEEADRAVLEQSRDELEKLHAGLLAPITAQEKLTGVLLFEGKLSGEVFSHDDLQLVRVVGPQIGSAIEKAKLYEEVKSFSEKLRHEVDAATEDLREANDTLKERNSSLAALQNITTFVTRTLDLKKIVQSIADSISSELGYLGGVVQFLSEDRKTLTPVAVTNTPLIKKALKLLPDKLETFTGDMEKYNTIDIQAIKDQKVYMTNKFSDALSPPVPKLIAQGMQKLIKIKSIVTVPIVSESKAIGAIHFGLGKRKEEVEQREVEMMQAVANQLGIVYRNLKLFEAIQKANGELETANEHLRTLDQAKSEFISIASHQLRTPMTGIMGYLSMIVGGDFGKVQPKVNTLLGELLKESQRMIRLINLFLNVSKIEAGRLTMEWQRVDLAEIVAREVNEVKKVAGDKGLKLKYTPPKKKLPELVGDPDKLADVILNLIDNAVKYTEQGSITVSIEQTPEAVQVHVTDTGIGIPPKETKGLFNKFVRGSGIARINPDGSGLGLFIAKRMVEMNHGKIWVTSKGKGKGSTFSFAIPIKPPAEGAKALKEKEGTPSEKS